MKERPILFSAEMVRAILEGRKAQTRRVIKPQSIIPEKNRFGNLPSWLSKQCPYGQPGDRLWVRETWAKGWTYQGEYPCVFYKADNFSIIGSEINGLVLSNESAAGIPNKIKWKPSIHMPRWASRITLQIKSVKVEKLQNISEEDALAEGITLGDTGPYWHDSKPLGYFRALWNSINGDGAWDQNPWVWVIEFEKLTPHGGEF